ncbi:hypothetical protein SAMN06273572_104119 [Monaibacterium marinum]|uniref:Uncharacterized protein n=1 Tax=Pontivivens marinum TaxID=1690039 RepID=A0A2C9CT89_9RHOB|nr:hypothetical protein [Monaibacterium marinum]SOH94420.1 hypothetical protein SAMN06273572_104119 [Monaibacterium marinum]
MDTIKVGQVWTSNRTATTPPLVCTIGAIDPAENNRSGEPILSITVTPHPKAQQRGWPVVGHMPVTLRAFKRSDLTLHTQDAPENPRFHAAYTAWRERYDTKLSGVFDASVTETYINIIGTARSSMSA